MACTARHKKTDTQTSGIGWVIGDVLLAACLYYNTGDTGPVSSSAPAPTTVAPKLAPPPEAAPEPMEDDPAFDCRVHGNRICGDPGSQAENPYTNPWPAPDSLEWI